MPVTKDKKTGRFKRQIKLWSPSNWNEGFLNNRGRFLVYKPDSKYVLYEGYVLRSYAVWEWYKKTPISKGFNLHHINGNKTDDRIENLKLITKYNHDKLEQEKRKKGKNLKCIMCNKVFYKPQWRLNQKGHIGKYCSIKCYLNRGSSK